MFLLSFYKKSKGHSLTSSPHLLPPKQNGTHLPGASAVASQQHTAHTENSNRKSAQC